MVQLIEDALLLRSERLCEKPGAIFDEVRALLLDVLVLAFHGGHIGDQAEVACCDISLVHRALHGDRQIVLLLRDAQAVDQFLLAVKIQQPVDTCHRKQDEQDGTESDRQSYADAEISKSEALVQRLLAGARLGMEHRISRKARRRSGDERRKP